MWIDEGATPTLEEAVVEIELTLVTELIDATNCGLPMRSSSPRKQTKSIRNIYGGQSLLNVQANLWFRATCGLTLHDHPTKSKFKKNLTDETPRRDSSLVVRTPDRCRL
jgi:hypothetical protein